MKVFNHKIERSSFARFYFIAWIVGTILYGFVVKPMCNHFFLTWIARILFCSSFIIVPFVWVKSKERLVLWSIPIFSYIFLTKSCLNDVDFNKVNDGPTIICKYHITDSIHVPFFSDHKIIGLFVTPYIKGYYVIGKDSILVDFDNHLEKTINREWIYVMYNFVCETPLYLYSGDPSDSDIAKFSDFAFIEDDYRYTYHDYSLKQPDLVYYKVGYNVVYKVPCNTTNISDNTALLRFTDLCGKNQSIEYSIKDVEFIPDTLLIYNNINEKIDTQWHVCAPEVNTPENRAKISDYGYIFHYDVYSKQEIESQCPRIREYVEQYKKRMLTNNINIL